MKTGTYWHSILSALLWLNQAPGAIVATTPVTHYRSLEDSPWREAVTAGDALVFVNHTWQGVDDRTYIGSIPQGYGVYDDFESQDSLTPWVNWEYATLDTTQNDSVDSDDGVFDYYTQAHAIDTIGIPRKIALEFIPMTNGEFPNWVGFVTILGSALFPTSLEIIGVDNSFTTISLDNFMIQHTSTPIIQSLSDNDLFIGFVSDVQIKSIVLKGDFRIDHFQYGYGPGPIPEPGTCSLGLLGVALALRRRRSKLA